MLYNNYRYGTLLCIASSCFNTLVQVLEGDEHNLHLPTKTKRERVEFKSKLALYYYRIIERIIIAIVLIDAVLTATKFSGIKTTHAEFLKYWQVCAMAK